MISPHDLGMKGSKGDVHDGRPDSDHEAELSKAGGQEKGEAHDARQAKPKEKLGDTHEEE